MFAIYHLVPSEYKGYLKYDSLCEPHNAFHSCLRAQTALDYYIENCKKYNRMHLEFSLGVQEVPFSDFFKDVSKNVAFGELVSNCMYEWKEYWEPYSSILERQMYYKIFDAD